MIVQPVTPHTIDETRDQLLLAGSKLTFSDIYAKEMKLPIVKGRYYKADDVDDTFILLNGVLTDIGQQAFRKHKQTTLLQEEANELRGRVADLEAQLAAASDVTIYTDKIDELQSALDKREDDLRTLALASKQKADYQNHVISQLQTENAQLNAENDEMGNLLEGLADKIRTLE